MILVWRVQNKLDLTGTQTRARAQNLGRVHYAFTLLNVPFRLHPSTPSPPAPREGAQGRKFRRHDDEPVGVPIQAPAKPGRGEPGDEERGGERGEGGHPRTRQQQDGQSEEERGAAQGAEGAQVW